MLLFESEVFARREKDPQEAIVSKTMTKTSDRGREAIVRAGEPLRLDPTALPQKYRYDTGIDPRSGRPMGEAAVVLDRSMASVCRRLPSGIPMAMRLPMAAFEGVAVRMAADPEDPAGEGLVVLELLHRDPHLSLPLSVARDLDDVVADWKSWARVLALPMLIVEVDGSWHPVETRLGAVVVRPTRPRRRRSVLAGRRPRFLTRRKVGLRRDPVVIEKCEIFGRE